MLIVVEPTRRSLGTAAQIKRLAEDIGIANLYLVGSKVQDQADVDFIANQADGLDLLGSLPFDPGVREADRRQLPLPQLSPAMAQAAHEIIDGLTERISLK
jgi:CO dehydrogenase maturation factor